MAYEIIWETRGVVKRFFGHLTDLDIEQSAEEVASHYQFDFLRYVINDFRDIASCSATRLGSVKITAPDGEGAAPNSLWGVAVVTTSPEIVALAALELASHNNPYPTQHFQSRDDAHQWLGLPPNNS
jgi:hypothetical protein